MPLSSIEICAGAGGQALGLEQAGFEHVSLVEIEPPACETLRFNRPQWHVTQGDVRHYQANRWRGVALLAGGVHALRFPKRESSLGLTTSGTFSRKPFVWCLNACPRP